jgi:hypothetical protein
MSDIEIPRWPKRSLFWDPEEEQIALQQLNTSRRKRGLPPFGDELLSKPEEGAFDWLRDTRGDPARLAQARSTDSGHERDGGLTDAETEAHQAQGSEPPTSTSPSEADVILLARLIFAEAGNHFSTGKAMEGVAWATANRVGAPGFPETLHDVIHQPKQFAVGGKQWDKAADPSSLTGDDARAYTRALDVAKGVLSRNIPDPTEGAQFFYSSPDGRIPGVWFPSKIQKDELTYTPDDRPHGQFYFLKPKTGR